jgi:outer membrane receptor protein involved in Fe transport
MNRMVAIFLFILVFSPWSKAYADSSLSGHVLEKGTRKPLSGVSLFLDPAGESALSDDTGTFLFPSVPTGPYRLLVAAVNYKKPEPMPLDLHEGENPPVTLYLEPEPISMMEIIVETERKPVDPGRQTLRQEEITKIPGSGGDVIMAIQNLPGVIHQGGYAGGLLTRGSGPFDNTILLDQMPVLQPLHFVGFVSAVNSDLIRSADFYAGGFSTQYGSAMGGVLDMTSREIRTDRWGTKLDINPTVSEARVEGPISEDSSLYLAVRRGFLEYIIDDPETTVIPIFNDYQIKFSSTLSTRHQLNLLSFGSYDNLFVKSHEVDARDPFANQVSLKMKGHTQGASLQSHINDRLQSTLTLFNDYNVQNLRLGPDLNLTVTADQVRIRSRFINDLLKHRLNFGFEAGHGWYKIVSHFIRLCGEGEPSCTVTDLPRVDENYKDTAYGAGAYLEDTVHINPMWDFTLGGRVDYLYPTRALDWSPRTSTLVHLNDRQRIKVAYGSYYQWPNQNGEFSRGFGTPTIGSNRSIHHVMGYEHQVSSSLDIDLQLYYKRFDHLIVPSNTPGVVFNNDGVGYAKGGEILLRHRPLHRFFGWLSYAYSESERRSHPGEPWRLSDYDRPHAATLVASYQISHRVNFGGRFRYLSGAPYTPVIGSRFDTTLNLNRPVYGPVNSDRLPAPHHLDLRLEYKERKNTYIMTSYVEIWNVYNNPAVYGFTYNDDFSVKKPAKGLGLIPFAGVMIEF